MEHTDLDRRRGRHNSAACGLDGGFEPVPAMAAVPGMDGHPQEFTLRVTGRGEGRVFRALNASGSAACAPMAFRFALAPILSGRRGRLQTWLRRHRTP